MKTYAIILALAVALLVFASLVYTGEGFHTPFPNGKRQIHESKKVWRFFSIYSLSVTTMKMINHALTLFQVTNYSS